jgi:hypothetical protein
VIILIQKISLDLKCKYLHYYYAAIFLADDLFIRYNGRLLNDIGQFNNICIALFL